jgi:hypothetical protein
LFYLDLRAPKEMVLNAAARAIRLPLAGSAVDERALANQAA